MSNNHLNNKREKSSFSLERRLFLGGLVGGALLVVGQISDVWGDAFFKAVPSPTLYTYAGHPSGVSSVAWSPDGTRIASVGWDQTIQVWNARDGQRLLTYRGQPDALRAVWSPDSTRIASAGRGFTVQVWNASTGQLIWTHQDSVEETSSALIGWSPDGRQVATSGRTDNGAIQIRNAMNGRLLLKYQGHAFVESLAWSPNSRRVASGGWNRSVQVWGALDGQKIWFYQTPDPGDINRVDAVAWSPDGKYIVSGGTCPIILFANNGGVQIWESTTGQQRMTYWGHDGRSDITAVAWSPDGKYIASGATDTTVQVWSAANVKGIVTYGEHTDSIEAVAWSPDGTRIVSGGRDRFVRVWRVRSSARL